MYINSKKVRLYPSAYRGKVTIEGVEKLYNPESRMPTEFNTTEQILASTSKESFMLLPTYGDTISEGTEQVFKFAIHGYIFRLKITPSSIARPVVPAGAEETTQMLWAAIKIADKGVAESVDVDNFDYACKSLVSFESNTSLDDSAQFTGLKLEWSENEPTIAGANAKLPILKCTATVSGSTTTYVYSTVDLKYYFKYDTTKVESSNNVNNNLQTELTGIHSDITTHTNNISAINTALLTKQPNIVASDYALVSSDDNKITVKAIEYKDKDAAVVGALKIIKCTAAEYASITKQNNTLYIILDN